MAAEPQERIRIARFRAILIIALQVVIATAGIASLQFLALGSPGCSPSCDFTGYSTATTLFLVVALAVIAASVLGEQRQRNTPRHTLWPPIVGTTLLLITWAATYAVAAEALRTG